MILQRYETLCKERGEFPSVDAAVAGYDRSALTNWRKQASENGGMSQKTPVFTGVFQYSKALWYRSGIILLNFYSRFLSAVLEHHIRYLSILPFLPSFSLRLTSRCTSKPIPCTSLDKVVR